MANREKGERELIIDGTKYTFVLNTNAMIACEEQMSTPSREVTWDEFFAKLINPKTTTAKAARVLFWAMLREYHRDLTLNDVSKLIDAAGGIGAMGELIAAASIDATPDPRDLAALGTPSRPPKAQTKAGGTGETSISTPAA